MKAPANFDAKLSSIASAARKLADDLADKWFDLESPGWVDAETQDRRDKIRRILRTFATGCIADGFRVIGMTFAEQVELLRDESVPAAERCREVAILLDALATATKQCDFFLRESHSHLAADAE